MKHRESIGSGCVLKCRVGVHLRCLKGIVERPLLLEHSKRGRECVKAALGGAPWELDFHHWALPGGSALATRS